MGVSLASVMRSLAGHKRASDGVSFGLATGCCITRTMTIPALSLSLDRDIKETKTNADIGEKSTQKIKREK